MLSVPSSRVLSALSWRSNSGDKGCPLAVVSMADFSLEIRRIWPDKVSAKGTSRLTKFVLWFSVLRPKGSISRIVFPFVLNSILIHSSWSTEDCSNSILSKPANSADVDRPLEKASIAVSIAWSAALLAVITKETTSSLKFSVSMPASFCRSRTPARPNSWSIVLTTFSCSSNSKANLFSPFARSIWILRARISERISFTCAKRSEPSSIIDWLGSSVSFSTICSSLPATLTSTLSFDESDASTHVLKKTLEETRRVKIARFRIIN